MSWRWFVREYHFDNETTMNVVEMILYEEVIILQRDDKNFRIDDLLWEGSNFITHKRENLLQESVWRVQLEELPRHDSVLEHIISQGSAHTCWIGSF